MKNFNGGKDIEEKLKMRIELHFDNKWKTDRNQAIKSNKEIELLEQLPEYVQNKIFLEFLY